MSTAQTQPQSRRPTVEFEINIPQEVALKYAGAGRIVAGKFGERMMYTLRDDRVMFVDLSVAERITQLKLNVGETFFVCKKLKDRRTEWLVWLTPETEQARAAVELSQMGPAERAQQPIVRQLQGSLGLKTLGQLSDGTFGVPKTNEGPAEKKPDPPQQHHRDAANATQQNRTTALVEEANNLVDAFAQVLDRALTTYQGRVKPDEVRALLLSAYIGQTRNGGGYAR